MDLEALVTDELRDDLRAYTLEWFDVEASTRRPPHATVGLRTPDGELVRGDFTGDGPVDAIFRAINAATKREARLREFRVDAVTGGQDALGEASVVLELAGQSAAGQGVSTDIIEAAALAYVRALSNAERRVVAAAERPRSRRPRRSSARRRRQAAGGQLRGGGAVEHGAGDDRVRLRHAVSYSARHARRRSPASRRSGPRRRPGSGGLGAISGVAAPRSRSVGHDRVEVAQRLAQEDERAEQHRLLAAQVGPSEQGRPPGRWRRGGPVEGVHQLVAARADKVEARFEASRSRASGNQTAPRRGLFPAARSARHVRKARVWVERAGLPRRVPSKRMRTTAMPGRRPRRSITAVRFRAAAADPDPPAVERDRDPPDPHPARPAHGDRQPSPARAAPGRPRGVGAGRRRLLEPGLAQVGRVVAALVGGAEAGLVVLVDRIELEHRRPERVPHGLVAGELVHGGPRSAALAAPLRMATTRSTPR